MKTRGAMLIEIILSLIILSTVVVTVLVIFQPGIRSALNSMEMTKLNFLLNKKTSKIESLGFWVWDVDTSAPSFPGNSHDPAEQWKAALLTAEYAGQGILEVEFLKEASPNLVAFSGAEFDGNTPRDKVKVTVSLSTSLSTSVTQTVVLYMLPTEKQLNALLYIMKQALEIYYEENSSYPTTLDTLVSAYLAELPNDPYTSEKVKITHTEEITDWHYVNNTTSNNITLEANSHFGEGLFWSY